MDTLKLHELALKAAVHIDRRADLPQMRSPAAFTWMSENGVFHKFTASETERQIIEHLRKGTLFCASRINLGYYVHLLRLKGAPITTYRYMNDSGNGSFGVYALSHIVRPYRDPAVGLHFGQLRRTPMLSPTEVFPPAPSAPRPVMHAAH